MLISLVSFGLGRLSINNSFSGTLELESTPVTQEELLRAQENKSLEAIEKGSGESTIIIGNKNSKIYHRADCVGAKLMSEKNKIYFSSISAAFKAGYTPAGNCPGLK